MLEIRWALRVVPQDNWDIASATKEVRVLQYRTRNKPFIDETGDLKSMPLEWSDWQDVPTVKE